MRVPVTGRRNQRRDEMLAHYRRKRGAFERVPTHRREAECADEGEATCLAMIAELEKQK